MLDRLEQERRGSARRALAAQEEERLRIARELHDGIGQTLTAVAMQAERATQNPQGAGRQGLLEIPEAIRRSIDDVLRIARELRPEASQITVSLRAADDHITLRVRDDGRGIELPLSADSAGISGMRERALLIGAQLSVRSSPGAGTEVQLDAPLDGDPARPSR